MKTDLEMLNEGVRTRFDTMDVIRNNFDYTEWQRHLWENGSLETIYQRAAARWEARERPAS